jgi:hypothetical protein
LGAISITLDSWSISASRSSTLPGVISSVYAE